MRSAMLLAMVLAFPAAASANVALGGDVSVLMREEGGGNRTAMPAFGPRLTLDLPANLRLSAAYAFTYWREGEVAGASMILNRLSLRPEYGFHWRTAAVVLGLGPTLDVVSTGLLDRGNESARATYARVGAGGGVALEVDLGAIRGRAGLDLTYTAARRLDLNVGIGAAYLWGGAQ